MRILVAILAIFIGTSVKVQAEALDYPELNVTPRASERLGMEMKWEKSNALGNAWPIAVAGLGTIVNAAMSSSAIDKTKDPDSYSTLVGYGIGAVSLGIAAYVSMSYTPYKDSYSTVRSIRGKGKRAQLTKERMAEEEIRSMSRIGKWTRYSLAIANIFANAYISDNIASNYEDPDVDVKEEDADKARLIGSIGTALSLLPIFFSTRWERVHDEQMKYKKRIYAPLSFIPITNEPFTFKKAAGLGVAYKF